MAAVALGDPLVLAGALAALIALAGALFLIPLHLTQWRDIRRLRRWQELEPERGDEGAPLGPLRAASDREASAAEPDAGTGRVGGRPSTGEVSPAERVTMERPALERITAERAAIEGPSRIRRLLAGGPRHPLVLALGAVLAAAIAVGGIATILDATGGAEPAAPGPVVPDEVDVAVLNASSDDELGEAIADQLGDAGYSVVEIDDADRQRQTVVMFTRGARRSARAVTRELGGAVIQRLDPELRPAIGDAEVVVLTGEDRARD